MFHRKGYNSLSSQTQPLRPVVHYPEELEHTPSAQYFNTPPRLDPRTPSFAGTDEEDDNDDEFDLSADEGPEEETKFPHQIGVNLKTRRYSCCRLFTILFSSLIGSTFLAGILVAPALLVHFFWYKPHPTSYRRYVDQNIQAWLFWGAANVVISWGLAMIVDIIPAITRLAISISWGHVSEEVKSHIELYDSVKDTFKPVLYASSAWLSWIILFQNIFKLYNSNANMTSFAVYTDRVAQIIEFLFFLALVVCAQRMLSHAIAFGFHRTAYKERLEQVKSGLHVIERLREHKPLARQQNNRSGGAHGVFNLSFIRPFSEKDPNRHHRDDNFTQGFDAGNDPDTRDNKGKGKQRQANTSYKPSIHRHDIASESFELEELKRATSNTVSEIPYQRQNASHDELLSPKHPADQHSYRQEECNPAMRAARVIKSAVLHDARNINGNVHDLNRMGLSINSSYEAKRLARAIYQTFYDHHRTYLIPEDFRHAFASLEEAREAFRIFDKDNNGDVSRSEIKATILRIYRERRLLWRSMRDVSVALKTLDQILLFFALVILFFISLSIFGLNVASSLTSVYTLGIAVSFIFKNAASSMFDAIIFLFVSHPFDSGDRCFIDTDNLTVKKMGLFATVFVRSDGTETYYSNCQLFTKFITNVRRSDKMPESLTMQVAWRTPLEKLDALEARLNEWLSTEDNRWFQPTTSITLQKISFQRHLELSIAIPHNSTWQDWGLRNARRTAFHAAVQHYCLQLGITAYESPMPLVYLESDGEQYTPAVSEADQDHLQRSEGANKSILGFTPPDHRSSQLLRTKARKGRGRKEALRGVGASDA